MKFSRYKEPKVDWLFIAFMIVVGILGLIGMSLGYDVTVSEMSTGYTDLIIGSIIALLSFGLFSMGVTMVKSAHNEWATDHNTWQENEKIHDAHDITYKYLLFNGWMTNITLKGETNE